MNRSAAYLYVVCMLLCCAPLQHASADEAQVDSDGRMTRLAQHLAEQQDNIDLPNGSESATPSQSESTGLDKAEGTPILQDDTDVSSVRTPLLRPGRSLDDSSPKSRSGVAWLLQTITALGIVIALALGVRYVYTRMGGKVASYASPVVEVLSRTTVAPRSHVMLLRVGGRVLVVSDSSSGMRTLASIDQPEEVADILGAVSAAKPASISQGFSQFLNKFHDQHEADPGGPGDEVLVDAEPGGRVRESVSGLLSRVRSMGRDGGAS